MGSAAAAHHDAPADPRARLRALADVARPITLAGERVLPVLPALAELLPQGGLQRGTALSVGGSPGATSLAFALAAGPSAAGSWVAALGIADLGLSAVAEAGVDLRRLAVVSSPGRGAWPTVMAALVDAFEVVVAARPSSLAHGDARRILARARERGAVLLLLERGASLASVGRIEGLDLRCTVTDCSWEGLGAGWGRLSARRLSVVVEGRRSAARPRSAELWLPSPDGRIAIADPDRSTAMSDERRAEDSAGGLLSGERGWGPRSHAMSDERRAM